MNKKITKKLFLQLLRFLIIGILAFIIDYLILILSHEFFQLNLYLSIFLAFSISVIFNYILRVKWIFVVKNNANKKFILFIVYSIIGLILTEAIMWVGTSFFKFNYLFVKLLATIIVMIYNFITRKLFLEK